MDYGIVFLIALVGVFKHLFMLLLSLHLCDGEINKNKFSILVWAVLLSVIETVVIEATMGEKIYLIQLMGYLLYGFVIYTYSRRSFYYGLSMSFIVRTWKLPISMVTISMADYYNMSNRLGMLLTSLLTVLFMYSLYEAFRKGKLIKIKSSIIKLNRSIYLYICGFYISIGVVIPYLVSLVVKYDLAYLYFGTLFNLAIVGMLLIFIIVYIGAQRSYRNKMQVLRTYLVKHGQFVETYDRYKQVSIPSHLKDQLNILKQVYFKTIFFKKIGQALEEDDDITLSLIACDNFRSRPDVLIEHLEFLLERALGNLSIELTYHTSYKLTVKSDKLASRPNELSRSNDMTYELCETSDAFVQILCFN